MATPNPFLGALTGAAEGAGLAFVGSAELRYDVPMTADALADYLLSQSNATSAIDDGRTTRADLRAWLLVEFRTRMPADVVPVELMGTSGAAGTDRATGAGDSAARNGRLAGGRDRTARGWGEG